jgi:hypothetical protein
MVIVVPGASTRLFQGPVIVVELVATSSPCPSVVWRGSRIHASWKSRVEWSTFRWVAVCSSHALFRHIWNSNRSGCGSTIFRRATGQKESSCPGGNACSELAESGSGLSHRFRTKRSSAWFSVVTFFRKLRPVNCPSTIGITFGGENSCPPWRWLSAGWGAFCLQDFRHV